MAVGGLRVNRKVSSTQQVQKHKANAVMEEYAAPQTLKDEEFGRGARQSSHVR